MLYNFGKYLYYFEKHRHFIHCLQVEKEADTKKSAS